MDDVRTTSTPTLVPPTGAYPVQYEPDLVQAFLASKSPKTLEAYRQDLEDFRKFTGTNKIDDAARALISSGHGPANKLCLDYRTHMVDRGLAPATINRRLSALRSLVRLACMLGMIPWKLEVPGVKSEAYRDTRGCGWEGVKLLMDAARDQSPTKAARDMAILHLMFFMGLRLGEVQALDVEDLDLPGRRVWVRGKGRTEKGPLTIPDLSVTVIKAWLKEREVLVRFSFSSEKSAVFLTLSMAVRRPRITPEGIQYVIEDLGHKAGIGKVRPHQLRHSAITFVLDSGFTVREAQRFARHKDISTTMVYDDNRSDLGGKVANGIAAKFFNVEESNGQRDEEGPTLDNE